MRFFRAEDFSDQASATAALVLRQTTALVPLLRAEALESHRLTRLTPAVVNALDQAGVFKIGVPEIMGGYDLWVREQVEILAEVARGDGSAGWSAFNAVLASMGMVFPPQGRADMLASHWAGPLTSSSIFSAHAKGTARRAEGGWLVKGTWAFCSNVQLSAWLLAGVVCQREGEQPFRGTVLLERGQYHIKDDWHVMGMAGTSSNTCFIDDEVFVPDHRFVSTDDMITNLKDAKAKYSTLGSIFPMIAALGMGMAKGAAESFIEQGKKRAPVGLGYETLAKSPAFQVVAGKTDAMIESAAITVRAIADEIDRRGRAAEPLLPEEINRVTMMCAQACHRFGEAIDLMQLAIGSAAASDSNPLQRYMCDMRVLNLHGANRIDVAAENHGRFLVGEPPHAPII